MFKYQMFYMGLGEPNPGNPSSYKISGQYGLQKELSTIFYMAST